MARTQNLSEYLTDIATAIKTKKGDETPINASKFDEEIVNLPTGEDIYEYFTEGNLKSGYYFIRKCIKKIPMIDISNITTMVQGFQDCENLEGIPSLDTSNVTTMENLFMACKSIKEIPPLNTSKVTNMKNIFRSCETIEELPSFDASLVVVLSDAFAFCNLLKEFGGLINIGQAYLTTTSANYSNYKFNLSYSNNLTHDSLMNVINNLYDIKSKGCNTQQLVLGSTNLAKLTAEEINIAVEKGFSVS